MDTMTIEQTETLERARRLVRAATGEDWGDGDLVTDVGVGMAEPGYPNDAVWVMGDFNAKRYPRDGDPELTNAETIGPRLARALERIGVETLWLDEWIRCEECHRVFRTTANSYQWRMSGLITEDGAVICAADLTYDDIEEEYLDNPRNALTFDIDLEEQGYERFNGRYQNGWHDGMNDDPVKILERAQRDGFEGIFKIPEVSQFYIEFELWVRPRDGEEE